MRVLTPSRDAVPVSQLKAFLKDARSKAKIEIVDGPAQSWTVLWLVPPRWETGTAPLARIEREPIPGSFSESELAELDESIGEEKPASAVAWLRSYFRRVQVVYVFELSLSESDSEESWTAIHALFHGIHETLGGIFQADLEGFTNEEGYHILWEFSDNATGPWSMAVLDAQGNWIPFEMDLGDPIHRQAFWAGEVPPGVKMLGWE
jgi:hypothetical protein